MAGTSTQASKPSASYSDSDGLRSRLTTTATTEAIRAIAIILAARFLLSAWLGESRHVASLWQRYFQPEKGAQLGSWYKVGSYVGLSATRRTIFAAIREWGGNLYHQVALGTWLEQVKSSRERGTLSATELFKGYADFGRPWKRGLRLIFNVILLFLGLLVVMTLLGDVPMRSCIRGNLSRETDIAVIAMALIGFFAVLFYAIDATRLASRMLIYLVEKRTAWPNWRKKQVADEWCLCTDDTYPLLDMRFAVEQTKYVRGFMLCPFILLLLLLVSRLRLFEAWTWPAPLIGVFVLDFVLAASCWAVLRRAAFEVRTSAVNRLTELAVHYENAALDRHRKPPNMGETATWIRGGTSDYTPEQYAQRLRQVIDAIKQEHRGAFAPWVQDPTYLFLFIPTGVTGILVVLLHFLIS